MVLDERQVAFITCVNDEAEYAECRYYLERLRIPEGYDLDVISIREAPSMAAGYNAGMKSSNAKYKVYLHQDVFIKNIDFITDMLHIFTCDEKIGMLGMIGKRDMGSDPALVTAWDAGRVRDNRMLWSCDVPSEKEVFTEVQAADGLLLATRYDIAWREDIFDGWDFYDISQCMEFRQAGYMVVVPWQKEEWCYHDDVCPKMGAYLKYCKTFAREYAGFFVKQDSVDMLAYETQMAPVMERMKKKIGELFSAGGKTELRGLFQEPVLQGQRYLREYEAIVCIDWIEEKAQSELRLWGTGMSSEELLLRLRSLKYALKRIEFGADHQEKDWIRENYSKYAIADVCRRYAVGDVLERS